MAASEKQPIAISESANILDLVPNLFFFFFFSFQRCQVMLVVSHLHSYSNSNLVFMQTRAG